MPTRRGWLVLALAPACLLAGRILGLVELYLVGVGAAAAVGLAVAYVRLLPLPVEASRRLRPPRAHHGTAGRVDLELANTGTRRIPPLLVSDPFDRTGTVAEFAVPGLEPGGSGRAGYRLPTEHRGRFTIGPLRLTLVDPLGLASSGTEAAGTSRLVVYPRITPVGGMPPQPGDDPHAGAVQQAGRAQGEDFYALRPYEVGDDLRRVHWPSTARSGDLMIRQLELPWQRRSTVVLDVRRAVHTAESLELAVTAAASILTGCHRDGATVRLVTTAGADSGFGTGDEHWEAALGVLAGARMTGAANLAATLSLLRRRGAGASVAVVTTTAAPAADLRSVAALSDTAGLVVVVSIDRSAWEPGAPRPPARPAPHRLVTVGVTADRPFERAWRSHPRLAGAHR